TDSSDARSTRYASDLAKGYEIPIIRVNADDPIACVRAIGMAYEYTKKFHKDCLLDLVGYRRYGHNEIDEQRATQTKLYKENTNKQFSCVREIGMAYEYTKKFHKDCLLDLVGYRRYGHNEMDEPRATQPKLYQEIDNHPTVTKVFGDVLKNEGIITADEIKEY